MSFPHRPSIGQKYTVGNNVFTFDGKGWVKQNPSTTESYTRGETDAILENLISNGLDADLLDGLDSSAFAPASHTHNEFLRSDTSDTMNGALTINGSTTRGTYTAQSQYHSGADNIVLKGNSSGISSIFFESEKDGVNINHPTDFGFIQYHPYGTSTSGESSELIIGVSNDGDDHVILNAPSVNGLKFRTGSSATDYTVYHSGNSAFAPASHTHTIANVDGLQTALDNATMQASEILTAIKTADGSGSGLDADLLDGKHLSDVKTEILNDIRNGAGTAYDTLKEIQSEIEANDLEISQWLDTNTWRPVVDNLTSTSTTNSLSAKQGKVLQDNKLDKTAKAADSGKLDGTQLDQIFAYKSATTDFNTMTSPGRYSQGPFTSTNAPYSSPHGNLLVWGSGSSATNRTSQLFNDDGGNNLHFRSQSWNNIWSGWKKIWHSGNDGSGSGLDADTVDGLHASQFLRSDANDTHSGVITFTADGGGIAFSRNTDGAGVRFYNDSDGDTNSALNFHIEDNGNEDFTWTGRSGSTTTELMRISPDGGQTGFKFRGNTVWHAGNDGSGSGLDADLLDGKQGSEYSLSHSHPYLNSAGGTLTGKLTLSAVNPQIDFNGTSDTGVDMCIKATPEGLDFREPEDGDKLHFQILDDGGVNAPFGYKVGTTTVINSSGNIAGTRITQDGTHRFVTDAEKTKWNATSAWHALMDATGDTDNIVNTVKEMITVFDSTAESLDLMTALNSINSKLTAPILTGSLSKIEDADGVQLSWTKSANSVDYYEVWSSVTATDEYALIGKVLASDVSTSTIEMTDDGYDTSSTTIYYKVYAVHDGQYSNALSASITVSNTVSDPTNLIVVPVTGAYMLQYDLPNDPKLDNVTIKKYASTTEAGANNEGLATVIYTGERDNFVYEVPSADSAKYHKFWVSSNTRI